MRRALDERIERIEAAMHAGEAVLAGEAPSGDLLARRTIAAALMVGAYQLHVEREYFDRYAAHPDEAVRTAARALREECAALRARLHAGARKTAAEAPDPADFTGKARAMNAAFRDHFAKVRALIDRAEPRAA